MYLSRICQWRGREQKNLKNQMMKIMDESILFFSRVSLSKFSLETLYISWVQGYLQWCVRGMRKVIFQPNNAFWQLNLATGMSRKFESRANWLARLEVLSCSAPAVVTLQLPYVLHTCATFGNLPIMRSSHETFLECTHLKFLHTLSHITLT